MSVAGFRDLGLTIHYEGEGDVVLEGFLVPTLKRAIGYDRLASSFSVASLIAIAQGIEGLWSQEGRMRLVLGVHAVPPDALPASPDVDAWADDLVGELKARLLTQISSLTDEVGRERIATVGWMMHEGLLEVKAAVSTSARPLSEVDPIFHSKRFILEDATGDTVAAVGSANETVVGLGSNFEDLTVHMSWQDPQGYVRVLRDGFERIWKNERPGFVVRGLERTFAREVLDSLGGARTTGTPVTERNELLSQILTIARSSPAFAIFNQGTSALYPHQERAFVDGLSRWPIRVLLADEVGLGKTLEGGAVIAYMMRFKRVKKALLLVPAGVMKQWQEELKIHFQIDAWLFDSTRRLFIAPNGRIQDGRTGVTGKDVPDVVLASIQFARGSRRRGHIFAQAGEMPDLVLVDEAHSARLKVDVDGSRRSTLVWSMLDDIKDRVSHLIFMTATPVQVDPLEYHGLLQLLGLPKLWHEASMYLHSLDALCTSDAPSLAEAAQTVQAISSVVTDWDLAEDGLTSILDDDVPLARRSITARSSWRATHELLVRTHPAHLLTIRNTRSALESYGYRFPERELSAPPLDVSNELIDFYSVVDKYLDESYGSVEQAIDPDRAGMGFAKSGYQQRLASSLHACRVSLMNRRAKLERLQATCVMEATLVDADGSLDEDEPESDVLRYSPSDARTMERVARAASIEKMYIQDLLQRLDRYEAKGGDPKFETMLDLLEAHRPLDRVLVFSRFTDTLQGAHRAYLERQPLVPGHAMYTGNQSWVDLGDGPVPASKAGVRRALDNGDIEVVFCSDAASEGLNLQSARVIINIDVPWNPARLEQRIGRIARLGQEADKVAIYNLWYPDSIESKIYSRLIARRDLYELAVGEFPELISKAIKDELASRFRHGIAGVTADPLVLLQQLRESEQHAALQRVWGRDPKELPGSTKFRQELLDVLGALADAQGVKTESNGNTARFTFEGDQVIVTALPGKETSLTLMSSVIEAVLGRASAVRVDEPAAELGVVMSEGIPFGFCLFDGQENRLLRPQDLPELISAAAGLNRFGFRSEYPTVTIGQSLGELPLSDWLPDHRAIRLGREETADQHVTEIKTLGRVPIGTHS